MGGDGHPGKVDGAKGAGGSGCSLSIPKPAYQSASPCAFKATPDIAAVGDLIGVQPRNRRLAELSPEDLAIGQQIARCPTVKRWAW